MWNTRAVIRVSHVGFHVNRRFALNLEELLKRLDDEDDGNERREALLSEAGDVLDEGAQIEYDDDEDYTGSPEPDPHTGRHEVPVVVPVKKGGD